MKKFFFTFGANHLGLKGTPEEGKSLRKKYVQINADSIHRARALMFERYGDKWSFSYEEAYFVPQIKEFGLTELETING